MNPPIIFFGNERLATGLGKITPVILPALINKSYNVVAVVVNDRPQSSRTARVLEVEEIALAHNIPIWRDKPIDLLSRLNAAEPALGVLVAYGRIIPQSIIESFKLGIVNLHPSLLPKLRGTTPIETAILEGSSESGVSIMSLEQAMDAGPLYAQKTIALSGDESKQELSERFLQVGGELLLKNLSGILCGELTPSAQTGEPTYTNPLTKDQSLINWDKPATQIEKEIRAYLNWPTSRSTIATKDVIITSVTVVQQSGNPGHFFKQGKSLGVYCKKGALFINTLKPAGKNDMGAAEFLAGNPL
ncbi:MAG: methionyl-tRNA formyltransferase [Candidatus Saccharimonadia bacterium]